ncbi:SHOCT domain-containing protein [Mycolicibacterium brumae]|uniref:SHOCT domain-containing protein n=1 Tax=Mycolicibacterium brumae TaxID=85968 RepID=A0A2G5PH19_9MYCO|nr:SHOCT domain-containing protein [Mycolicibacterium brumae]MCV7192371.1 SHOCT domain-containing protein [Mycolicibacterium brumae]PIB77602.1 hypothetical protein CQY22_001260 [Mycolicibacterium brumae]RWA18637.1 hypothetical protein MBRU_05320 [Mycolicibacterium brumae DSM 44177]UWW10140.1 SHOCT domain-containing protein [Mycolicibacterium brumae]
MFLRYLKAQAAVLLCGGLVGPIFLTVYFALGSDPLLKWMFWTGLLVTAGDVLVALWLTSMFTRSAGVSERLDANGIVGLARITSIQETNTQINDRPLVKLRLHIEAPGLAPMDVEDRVIASITRLPLLSGRELVVMVDPDDRSFRIDWDRSALVAGAVPATFTLAEDGRTYDLTGQSKPLIDILRILQANGIPFNGVINVRDNPSVRQQVSDVVRAAGRSRESVPTNPAPEPAEPKLPFAQRIQELEQLRANGLISEAEYVAKRQQIIADL